MTSHRFLDFSRTDKSSDAKTSPEPEQDRYTGPHNDMGRKIKDVDDLAMGTGTVETTDFKSVDNFIPPRGTSR